MKDRHDAGRTRELFLPPQELTRAPEDATMGGEVEKHRDETKHEARPTTEVFDRGRRGEPLLGCDCMQCFGYCIVDHDVARCDLPDYDSGSVEDTGPIEEE